MNTYQLFTDYDSNEPVEFSCEYKLNTRGFFYRVQMLEIERGEKFNFYADPTKPQNGKKYLKRYNNNER